MTDFPTLSKQAWPRESSGLDDFYGNPRGSGDSVNPTWESENITHVPAPWSMQEDGTPVTRIAIHKKAAESLSRVLNAIWDFVNHDQSQIDSAHLNEWGGSYNYRTNRNNPSSLSLHAYAAAVDIAPNENPNGKAWRDDGTMLPRFVIDAFLAEGWSWGGDFSGTKDPMHFQATLNTHSDAPSASVPTTQQPQIIDVTHTATTDPSAARMRAFLLSESSILTDVEAFKSETVAALNAIAAKVSAFDISKAAPIITQPTKDPAPPLPPVKKFTGICATVFGGSRDYNESGYDRKVITDTELGVALPYHFPGKRPLVRVWRGDKSILCQIRDIGPWNWTDTYWLSTGTGKPRSIIQRRNRQRADNGKVPTNNAGIDLTPAAAVALGIISSVEKSNQGMSIVDWAFEPEQGASTMTDTGQSTVTVPVGSPLASKINWTSIVQIAATLLTIFSGGKLNLTAEQQVAIIGFIGTIAPLATMIFRTFGTTTIMPQSLK